MVGDQVCDSATGGVDYPSVSVLASGYCRYRYNGRHCFELVVGFQPLRYQALRSQFGSVIPELACASSTIVFTRFCKLTLYEGTQHFTSRLQQRVSHHNL